ncbi:hypothetical protein M8J77_023890 [Diaphorina citri]|nr:hypothetical protein M8J77_023890 [Diaphorina citri]
MSAKTKYGPITHAPIACQDEIWTDHSCSDCLPRRNMDRSPITHAPIACQDEIWTDHRSLMLRLSAKTKYGPITDHSCSDCRTDIGLPNLGIGQSNLGLSDRCNVRDPEAGSFFRHGQTWICTTVRV